MYTFIDYCFLEDVNRCVDFARRHLADKKIEWRGARRQGQRVSSCFCCIAV